MTFDDYVLMAVEHGRRNITEIPKALPKPGNETRPPETPEQRKAAAEAALAKLAEMGLNVRDIGRSPGASP